MEEREKWLDDLVKTALAEDAARKDATTRLLVDASRLGDAVVRAGEPGVVSGHVPARETFRALDPSLAYSESAPDGARVPRGAVVARIYGHVRAILSAERTALNFLRHLSGVATLAAAFEERVRGTGVVILDTRKTTPGLRVLEKAAVVHGGARNHRANLAEMILVKENHLAAAGGLAAVIAKLGSKNLPSAEIEVRSLEEVRMMKETPPRRIMLDNFEPEAVREAVAEIKGWAAAPEIEVSGGVTLGNVAAYAIPGVDFLSIGALTSSAPALDMSLDLEGVDRK
ncbi:MAG: carboxylating nicotinate-nucleotide diphosphorylase [Candidatus Krumholzibacteria bacterium]|nr:carboxylating nicotinate-nucleotide diphosphorylase [Candidatus Krumholzibacteria bacterium]